MAEAAATQATLAPILTALSAMQSNVDRTKKEQAHEFLNQFQKSPEAWTSTHAILQSTDASLESKLFAATTLKGKITYDLNQLPRQALTPLRDSLLSLLQTYRAGPKPIRTQLCVCLANLAFQMIEWKNVLQLVVSVLGSDMESGNCLLDFLRILPEEVNQGRKILLTEDELNARTTELLDENAPQVLRLLIQYAQSSAAAATNPQLMECITSWLPEIPVEDVVNSPLLDTIIHAVTVDVSFEAAVLCIRSIALETSDVDATLSTIQTLYPRIMSLRPKIAQAADEGDPESLIHITRLFAEAGEAWVVLMARSPQDFRGLAEAILECAARDQDRDAVSNTFSFWYELKMMIVLEKYIHSRLQYVDIYSQLNDIMLRHLEYPTGEGEDPADLFGGDRELEEKFRMFRHSMGDVLKDCCEVIGTSECLGKSFALIKKWVATYGSQATDTNVPHWQALEAPLFSLRAMGRMVNRDESTVLPQIMPLLVQVPSHEKVRFAAIMALGRYTEWTAEHPEFLEPQLNFIIAAFHHDSKEVVRAAALALKFFCQDCRKLLRDHAAQLQQLYNSVLDTLPQSSQEEITEGVAHVVAAQPPEKTYQTLKLYCEPLLKRLMAKANAATDEPGKLAVADHLQLLTLFIQTVTPYVEPSEENPAVKYWQEVFPLLSAILDNFIKCGPICERVCRCWREMIFSYRTAMTPILPALADKLSTGFAASKQGCFLWCTDAIVREFSEGAEFVDANTTNAIYQFLEQMALSMLRALDKLPPEDLPDVIEDFFRLLIDALLYYPHKLIPSLLFTSIFEAALSALTLQQANPLTATLHYLRDVLGYGGDNPPASTLNSGQAPANRQQIKEIVRKLVLLHGETLVQRILTGMMFSFPEDCFADASGVLLGLVELVPQQVIPWITSTMQMLPPGTVSEAEVTKLLNQINQRIQGNELRKVRVLLKDFTNSYRRRNVAPRDGLGRLEAARFRFSG